MIASSGQARQVLLSVPNVLFFLNLSSLPFLLSHSPVVCLHSSLAVSLTQSQSISLSGVIFSFMFVSYTTDSFITLSLFRFNLSGEDGGHKDTSVKGRLLPSLVTVQASISLRGCQKSTENQRE